MDVGLLLLITHGNKSHSVWMEMLPFAHRIFFFFPLLAFPMTIGNDTLSFKGGRAWLAPTWRLQERSSRCCSDRCSGAHGGLHKHFRVYAPAIFLFSFQCKDTGLSFPQKVSEASPGLVSLCPHGAHAPATSPAPPNESTTAQQTPVLGHASTSLHRRVPPSLRESVLLSAVCEMCVDFQARLRISFPKPP